MLHHCTDILAIFTGSAKAEVALRSFGPLATVGYMHLYLDRSQRHTECTSDRRFVIDEVALRLHVL